jgi:hypothetical protein
LWGSSAVEAPVGFPRLSKTLDIIDRWPAQV